MNIDRLNQIKEERLKLFEEWKALDSVIMESERLRYQTRERINNLEREVDAMTEEHLGKLNYYNKGYEDID